MRAQVTQQISGIINEHRELVARFAETGFSTLVEAADAIYRAIKRGKRLYICGNGGSAADAQHIAAELVGRFEAVRAALPATALTTDTSVLTAIGNDDGYEGVFTRQVEALVRKGDVLWALSTSGGSANIVAAARCAKRKGALILSFTGRKDSPLEKISDICLCAASKSAARSQEIHQLAYHIICKLIEQAFTPAK
jgi:D-sedoheptulose 7-phosphate isomerase